MPGTQTSARASEEKLESWKEIAAYLGKGVRTVVRWEKSEGLPVHRHLHDRRSSVFAYKAEIDAWWQTRRAALDPELPAAQPTTPTVRRVPWVTFAAIASLAGMAVWFLRPPSPSRLELPLKLEPLTSHPGAQFGSSFSPDGSHFAFEWR